MPHGLRMRSFSQARRGLFESPLVLHAMEDPGFGPMVLPAQQVSWVGARRCEDPDVGVVAAAGPL